MSLWLNAQVALAESSRLYKSVWGFLCLWVFSRIHGRAFSAWVARIKGSLIRGIVQQPVDSQLQSTVEKALYNYLQWAEDRGHTYKLFIGYENTLASSFDFSLHQNVWSVLTLSSLNYLPSKYKLKQFLPASMFLMLAFRSSIWFTCKSS